MKTRPFFFLAGLLGAAAAHPSLQAATPFESVPVEAGSGPEAQLKPEMPSAAVLEIMGKPDSVSVLRSDAGKAEVWTYHRQAASTVERTELLAPSGTAAEPFVRPGDTGAPALPADYHAGHHLTTQVIQILMFNDRYAAQKVTREVSVKAGP